MATTLFNSVLDNVRLQVVPLGNEMRRPREYLGLTGVLNRGMVPIVLLYIFLGFFGYLKYGSGAEASITLNLPEDEV